MMTLSPASNASPQSSQIRVNCRPEAGWACGSGSGRWSCNRPCCAVRGQARSCPRPVLSSPWPGRRGRKQPGPRLAVYLRWSAACGWAQLVERVQAQNRIFLTLPVKSQLTARAEFRAPQGQAPHQRRGSGPAAAGAEYRSWITIGIDGGSRWRTPPPGPRPPLPLRAPDRQLQPCGCRTSVMFMSRRLRRWSLLESRERLIGWVFFPALHVRGLYSTYRRTASPSRSAPEPGEK
jgi:hypothetical protein